jgi:NAD(P)-dependent dehydrogenase (short-subunit alcohol dehydrogenase family)
MWLLALLVVATAAVWYWRTAQPRRPAAGNGRTVLVTGAASGVGRCVALRLNELGYHVVAGDVNQGGLEELRALQPTIEIVSLNVASPVSVNEVVSQLLQKGVYGVINVAGISNPQPVLTCSEEVMKTIFEVNAFGPMRIIRGLYPALRASQGVIINVTSVAGKCAWPWQGFYAATKFALEGFSDVLRREIGRFGIRTVLIEPGPIMTPMVKDIQLKQKQWLEENPSSEFHSVLLSQAQADQKQSPLIWHWLAVTPEKVAETIVCALGSSTPCPRYVVATPAFLIVFRLLMLLPDRWADVCMTRMMG